MWVSLPVLISEGLKTFQAVNFFPSDNLPVALFLMELWWQVLHDLMANQVFAKVEDFKREVICLFIAGSFSTYIYYIYIIDVVS